MRRLGMLSLIAATLALGLVAEGSCALPEPLPQRIARADAVVYGRVVAFEGGPIGNRRALMVEVIRVHKGSAYELVFVSAGPGGEGGGAPGQVVATSVDYTADIGTAHTFYLKQIAPAGFSTDACSGSHPGDLSTEELAALGPGRAAERTPGGVGSATDADRLIALAVALLAGSIALTYVAFRRSLAR